MPDKHPSTLSEISVKDLPALVKGEEDLVYFPQSQDRESGKYEIRDTTGKLDFDGALDEVVADGCEMMLKRSSVVSTLARENPSLFDRIHDWLKEWAAKIRKAFSGVEAYHEEAKAMLDYMDQLQKIWDKALAEAARNAADVRTETKTAASDGGRVQYMARDRYGNVVVDENVTEKGVKATIKKVMAAGENGPAYTFPVLKHTPQVIRDYCFQTGDRSFVMQSKKVYDFMKKHGLDENDVYDAIIQLHTPQYIVYQNVGEHAGHYAVVVAIHDGETLVALDLGDYREARDAVNGESGYYNVVITTFDPMPGYLDREIFVDANDVLYDYSVDKQYEVPEHVAEGDTPVGLATETSSNISIRSSSEKSNPKKSERDYSYERLISKPDMKLTVLTPKSSYQRDDLKEAALKNAESVGYKNKNGNAVVHVADIKTDVIVTKRNIAHGLDRRIGVQGPAYERIGEILKNAIQINELNPKNIDISNTSVLIGAASSTNGMYIVTFVINKSTNEMDDVSVLYAANAKKEPAALLPTVTGNQPATPTDSIISIADLLDYVNKLYPDVLPESVLKHYGYKSRPEGKLGASELFQERDFVPDDRQLLMEAASKRGSSTELKAYSRKVKQLNTLQHKLERQQAILAEAEEQDKAATRKFINKTEQQIERAENALAKMEASPALKAEARSAMAAWREANPNQAAETLRRLREVNRALEKDLAYWKGQAKRTEPGENSVRPEDVRRMAREIASLIVDSW